MHSHRGSILLANYANLLRETLILKSTVEANQAMVSSLPDLSSALTKVVADLFALIQDIRTTMEVLQGAKGGIVVFFLVRKEEKRYKKLVLVYNGAGEAAAEIVDMANATSR
ncbi:uncharacterized protein KY384_002907 [Bacidia gigantensis]|uniref:uncharacterized protein n=1 Tax=Bacidia gigantensis TaxID=2732470 RepID=UPI001D044729|nr:uncharacterized protein KY384_002907 [Bacidia gigantensis]KAG8532422.1 hypothetical protein KY384_002907 [Bacidia gigantensis]